MLWHDRALTMLNGTLATILTIGLLKSILEHKMAVKKNYISWDAVETMVNEIAFGIYRSDWKRNNCRYY